MNITIITITYNNLSGLKKTAESIIRQSYQDFEWIIIDGGSTDGTRDYLYTLERKPDFICSEKDNGVYDAMNKGIKVATGEYLWFMNAGDTFHDKNTLEQVKAFQKNEDIIYGNWANVYTNKTEICQAPYTINPYTFYYTNICHQAMLIKTSLLKESPFDTRYKLYADWSKWRYFYHSGNTFAYIPVVMCDYEAETGISAKCKKLWKEEKQMMMEEAPEGAKDILRLILDTEEKNTKHLKMVRILIAIVSALLTILSILVCYTYF